MLLPESAVKQNVRFACRVGPAYAARMPRLTPQRSAQRREQIVDATIRCIARHGFQGATMAQIIAESGLSAGAVYAHFRSKMAILEAVAQAQLTQLLAVEAGELARPEPTHPADVIGLLLEHVERAMIHHPAGDLSVAIVQIWAQAALGGELREVLAPQVALLLESLTQVVARWRDAGHLPPETDAEQTARVLASTLPGYLLQRLVLGEIPRTAYVQGLRDLMAGR